MIIESDELSKQLDITPPFLMIDTFEVLEKGKTAVGIKDLSEKEWFFACHLPNSPVMPATLQIEGMLQTLVLLIYDTYEHNEERAFINDIQVKMLSKSLPNQKITYEAELLSSRRGISKGQVVGKHGDQIVCKGNFTYASPHLMAIPMKP